MLGETRESGVVLDIYNGNWVTVTAAWPEFYGMCFADRCQSQQVDIIVHWFGLCIVEKGSLPWVSYDDISSGCLVRLGLLILLLEDTIQATPLFFFTVKNNIQF